MKKYIILVFSIVMIFGILSPFALAEYNTTSPEYQGDKLRKTSQKNDMDITNLSDKKISEQVLSSENIAAIDKAKKAGIKTDGLTYTQVMGAIEEWDRENARNNFGINTNGMTYSQVIEAVQKQVAENVKAKDGIIKNDGSKYSEQLTNDLIISAKALGIDYKGLSYDEIYEKVIAAKKASVNNK